jgi:hypothetical protein
MRLRPTRLRADRMERFLGAWRLPAIRARLSRGSSSCREVSGIDHSFVEIVECYIYLDWANSPGFPNLGAFATGFDPISECSLALTKFTVGI